jgi:integrase
MVLWHTGARVGEIRGLTTSMIDQTGDVWKAIPEKHKTAHHGLGRTIYLGPRAIQALRPWLRPDEPDAAIFAPARSSGRTAKRTGRLRPFYSRVSLPQAIRRGCARAGVEPWTLAQLRHSRATQIREHHDLDAATVVLGHTRPTMTMHYSREAIAHAVEVVRVVG